MYGWLKRQTKCQNRLILARLQAASCIEGLSKKALQRILRQRLCAFTSITIEKARGENPDTGLLSFIKSKAYSYLWPASLWQATQSVAGFSAMALCI